VGNARRAGLTRPAAGTAFSCRDAQRGDLPLHYAFTPLTKDLINVPNMFKQKTSLEDLSLHMPIVGLSGLCRTCFHSLGDGTRSKAPAKVMALCICLPGPHFQCFVWLIPSCPFVCSLLLSVRGGPWFAHRISWSFLHRLQCPPETLRLGPDPPRAAPHIRRATRVRLARHASRVTCISPHLQEFQDGLWVRFLDRRVHQTPAGQGASAGRSKPMFFRFSFLHTYCPSPPPKKKICEWN
jgi:hypothetical protein